VVLLLRSKAGNASLQVLDTICENPELIWTAVMQGELREAILNLLGPVNQAKGDSGFSVPPVITPDYAVKYSQLSSEIYVGGVYIRLYLKQPTFRLSNPVFFLEKLVEFWDSSFTIQVPIKAVAVNKDGFQGTASDSRSVVLGNEDFLTLLTSCIVCVVKGEASVVDHLLSWGFVHSLCDLLKRAITTGRRGSPMVCIIRLLNQLIGRMEVVDNLACAKVDIVSQLTLCLDNGSGALPKDATIIVELLKKIFQTTFSRFLGHFVGMAMNANLPNFLLDHVLGASPQALAEVTSPSALKIHAVDLLKAIIAADESHAAVLQALLDVHPSWNEFKDQSHDLFITVSFLVIVLCRI
jgi:DnaJ family protein C protein 13